MNSVKKSTDETMTSFEREVIGRRKQLQKKAKTVRFEDYLDDAASGYVGGLRRKFKAEDRKSRLKQEVLSDYQTSYHSKERWMFSAASVCLFVCLSTSERV